MNEVQKELARRLKAIYDDRDFVNGIMTIVTRQGQEKLLDFLVAEEEDGTTYNSDEVTMIALKMGKEFR